MSLCSYFVDVENIKPQWLLRALDVVSRSPVLQTKVNFIICTRKTSLFTCVGAPWVQIMRASSDLPEAADVLIILEVFKAAQKGNSIYIVHGGDRVYDTTVHQILGMIANVSIDRIHYKDMSFVTHQALIKKKEQPMLTKKKEKPILDMAAYSKPLSANFGDFLIICTLCGGPKMN
jgi:hypothetical protein